MPEAVIFHYQGKPYTVYFARQQAMLPIVSSNGQLTLLPWGRRQSETGELPLGGWARLTSIHEGSWNQYLPKPVRLPIDKFMQTDYEGHTHWYDVGKSQYIQGLLAHVDNEYRVYIVTLFPERLDVSHDRWPRIVIKSAYQFVAS